MFWKLLLWFNFLPRLLTEDGEIPYEPDDSDECGTSRFERWRSALPTGNVDPKKKSRMIKILFIALLFLLIYFAFLYGKPHYLKKFSLCGTDCKSGNGEVLKIKPEENGNGSELELELDGAYSELSQNHQGESIFTIFAKKKNNGNGYVAFNVARSIHPCQKNGADCQGSIYQYRFIGQKGNPCYLSKCPKNGEKCCEGGNGCCCCDKKKEECCCCKGSNGACCTSSDGKKCCCCKFMQLVDAATINTQDPNRLTPTRVFFSLLPTLLYLMVFVFMARATMKGQLGVYGGKGSIFGIGRSVSKTHKSDITFKDVAGIKEEKEELEEIVDFLKRPKKYSAMGARIPKGVILYGPPGTGKTLLAKAVSGESNVPFLEASGASFDDMFVGVGAKRVRELFEKAKKLAPCIIFIDEIDALAGKRGGKFNIQGNEQTINQLLSEMDGFNTHAGIIIIAATNRLDSIDQAVLRPGRFDRHIQINLPDIAERREILTLHAKNKNLSNKVNLEEIARKTPGFSGAQLENVLNEAALLAVRVNKKVISTKEIDEAIDRVMAGPAKKGRKISFSEKKQIAYHEAGHAIAGMYTEDGEIVEKITIIPRGQAAGYVLSVPKVQERTISTKSQLLSSILTMLAGRAAEEIFFGVQNISTGASNDLYKATQIARNIVLKFGMTDSAGMVQYIPSEEGENPYKNNYSEKYAEIIDKEVQEIISTQYENAKKLLEANKVEFLLIVETLLLLETIDRAQIEFIHKYKRIPKEAEEEKARVKKENKQTTPDIFFL
ncbi:cell division protease ftsH-like protein [Mycoplasma wenyonii str. Massachusetts]|uniref:ATP-dependent zinc metalloprotease FtsH n=1 Tax=Mycoplasma wenyonii (strain Massachusetts) TaxID=1197325 RepID=I6ZFQ3_MYCWM|nr:ATP-dependent zinc metalloprotease FtsH [Mycoplasma wenyonii]AFN65457.1 cell division protease ftsH-like protein [Mycoplasma wenyonii str. Massachusetts]